MGKNPFLYKVVDILYDAATRHAPSQIQEHDRLSAAFLGYVGSTMVVKGLQWTSRNVMFDGFDKNWLPTLEKICIVGMTAIPVARAILHPKRTLRNIIEHPTYTSGMVASGAACIIAAKRDLDRRERETEPLEKIAV